MFRVGVWLATLVSLSLAGIEAQTPAPRAARETRADGRLPVRRVVLYKSGVGYFEHLGRIRGDQSVLIDFTSGQLNDVLKSLTALDLGGGRVTGVSYNSEAGIDRRLGALRLPIGSQPTRAEFLTALRGARLAVDGRGGRVTGRLLGVETIEQRNGDATSSVEMASLVTDNGDLRSIALDAGVSVRIVDAELREEVGKYLAVTASARDQDLRRLTIATAGSGDRDLLVSYVSEVPVWKATYRLVLPPSGEARRPMLQGWAVVDNTIGEDWTAIDLSLVAGAPQSFIQHISQPFYLQRPIVPLPAQVLLAPQTHQGALAAAGPGAIAGVVRDASGGVLPGVTVIATSRTSGPAARAVTVSSGQYRMPNVPPGIYDLRFTLPSFRPETRTGLSVSGGMESVLNVTMQVGRLSEEMTVTAGTPVVDTKKTTTGSIYGNPASVQWNLEGAAATDLATSGPSYMNFDYFQQLTSVQADAVGAQLGDLFEYRLKAPVTIRKNESALVPILAADVVAEKVSLWSPASRINRPLRAVWLTNTT
ncbi:MAG TPA: carboxypeptidase-like regulatory domain-containing protein, partial [Vicinamibacterales bacterium]|nr:carboxypeptidase-like regulatory domain-containing protein [Vicinamibacterales bacterium]